MLTSTKLLSLIVYNVEMNQATFPVVGRSHDELKQFQQNNNQS